MVLFIILGVVVLMTFGVLGVLFFMLGKEGQRKEEERAVPVTDMAQLKKELSNQLFEPNEKVVEQGSEIIPVFQPKVGLPTQESKIFEDVKVSIEAKPSLEDEAYKRRAQQLEDELLAISKKADGQSDEARQLIENLTKENESLKSQKEDLQQAQQKLAALQGEAADLKTENIGLQTQLETTNTRVRLLEEEMAAVKIQMGEEITNANARVAELNLEKAAILSAPPAEPEPDQALHQELEDLKLEHIQLKQKYDELQRIHLAAPKVESDGASHEELEALKVEQAELKHKCEDLEKKQQELNESNAQLLEKNELLQYELIKARAQSSGLERVSFNYKNQLEDFFKKVNAVQVTNDHLAQVKNRLEGMVEEVKLQNEELAQKDRLAQFELEKNRSRLVSLEREYEELKARLQQQSQQ